jgi:hypothetical protein
VKNDKRLILTLDHLEDNTAKKELHVHTKNYPHSLEQPFQPYKSNLEGITAVISTIRE